MILAAGKGERLKPFSDSCPKPMIPLMGIPMIQYVLDWLSEHGIRKVVVNYHHLPKVFQEKFSALDSNGMELVTSDESHLLLDTAGGLRKAIHHFQKKPFLVVNADAVLDFDLHELFERHNESKRSGGAQITLAIGKVLKFQDAPYREILMNSDRTLLSGIGAKKLHAPYYLGVSVIEPAAIEPLVVDKPLSLVSDVIEKRIPAKEVATLVTDCYRVEVDSPQSFFDAHVEVMRDLESPGTMPLRIKRRIESVNERIGKCFWVQKDNPSLQGAKEFPLLKGPLYLSVPTSLVTKGQFGPNCVFYSDGGNPSGEIEKKFQNGIFFNGKTHSIL